MRLLYWPVTRVGNLCDANRTTLTGTATGVGPNTYANKEILGDLTITSPTVAISVRELVADPAPRFDDAMLILRLESV